MATDVPPQQTLAVLIDAENAQPSVVVGLLAEVAKYGVACVKRIYGDWTAPQLGGWKAALLEHSINPVQQFRYTTGKNASDSALIIDAMDLLYTGHLDGFCLVSSDSDFTRLASRLREAGKRVYGFGEQKTPKAFVSACDKFIYTEVLAAGGDDGPKLAPKPTKALRSDMRLVGLIRDGIEAGSDDSGWAQLGQVGTSVIKQAPEFDPRNYGFKKFGDLVAAIGLFETSRKGQNVLVREKPKTARPSGTPTRAARA